MYVSNNHPEMDTMTFLYVFLNKYHKTLKKIFFHIIDTYRHLSFSGIDSAFFLSEPCFDSLVWLPFF